MKLSKVKKPMLNKNPSGDQIAECLYQGFAYHNEGGVIRKIAGTRMLMCKGFKTAISTNPVDGQADNIHWFCPNAYDGKSKIQVCITEKEGSPDTFLLKSLSDDSQVPEEITIFRIEPSVASMLGHEDPTVRAKGQGWVRLAEACVEEYRKEEGEGTLLGAAAVARLYNEYYVSKYADDMGFKNHPGKPPHVARKFETLPETNQPSWLEAIKNLGEEFKCIDYKFQAQAGSASASTAGAGLFSPSGAGESAEPEGGITTSTQTLKL